MATGKKKKAKKPAARKAPAKAKSDPAVDAMSELVSVLACPKSVVNQLGLAGESFIDEMDVAVGFARFASAVWAKQPGQYNELDEIARDLVTEYERHANALAGILDRLAPLAEEGEHEDHEDLDPIDVLARVQPMLESTDEAQA